MSCQKWSAALALVVALAPAVAGAGEAPPGEALLEPAESCSVLAAVDPGAAWLADEDEDCIPREQCCKVCDKGKACGNTCISRSYTCHKGRGCAWRGSVRIGPPGGDRRRRGWLPRTLSRELHIAGTPVDAVDGAAPPSVVVEPPNLCQNDPPGGGSWTTVVTNDLLGKTCLVRGFPRIYDEHLVGEETATNPHHMLEIHPALTIDCQGGGSLDASSFIAYHDGMSEIQPSSAAACFDTRLWVRRNAAEHRYEFRAQRSRRCGNFASFEFSIFDDWIRELGNGGHSALVRVRPEGLPFQTLKIYTYPGTAADDLIHGFEQSEEPQDGAILHGMMTRDYFAIVKTARTRDGTFLPLSDWTEVPFPLALVAFGQKPDPDPDEHE